MINEKFINECKNRANANRLGKITINGIEKPITNSDNLQSFSIDSGCYVDGNIIGSVYAKCLSASFITDIADLSEKSIYAQIGVKYDDSKTEYISMGKYRVERPNNEITANMSQITAYDDLYTNLDNKYVCGIDYSKGNITVRDLYIDICNQLGLTPKTTSFINDNIPIEDNPFTNGEKNRTVLQTVCKISCSFVDVDVETNEIDLCWLSQSEEPDYTFYKNDYVSTEGGQVVCGPINCLIIKNSQIDSENVTKKDDKDIAINGEHSITISEDYILHNEELRQLAINNIWNRVHGMKYVDCKLTTYYGKPFLKLGNKIRVYIDDNNTKYFDTYVLKHNFTYDGSFNSIIESPALTQQEIKSKQDISLGQALLNTQIDVDKQNKRITALVSTVGDIEKNIQTSKKINNYPLVVEDAGQYDVEELKVYGNSEQDTSILSEEYTQVEYVESDGNQYIDTGVKLKSSYGFDIKYLTNNPIGAGAEAGYGCIFGGRNSSGDRDYQLTTFKQFDSGCLRWGNADTNILDPNITLGVVQYCSLRNNIFTDGTFTKTEFPLVEIEQSNYNAFLFGLNEGGRLIQQGKGCRIYYLRLYNENDTLIRNFVPCIRKKDNTVGFYDTVGNTFYVNSGTGTFTYGSNEVIPNPDYPSKIRNVEPIENLFNANNIKNKNIIVEENGKKIVMPLITSGNGVTDTQSTLQDLCPNLSVGDTVYLFFEINHGTLNPFIWLNTSDYLWYKNTKREITETDLKSKVYLYGNRFWDGELEQITLIDFIIVKENKNLFVPYGNWLKGKITGRNLFNKNNYVNTEFTSSIATALQNYKNSGIFAKGYFDTPANNKLLNNNNYITAFIPIKDGKTYTAYPRYDRTASWNFAQIFNLDNEGNIISYSPRWTEIPYIHTATEQEKYMAISIRIDEQIPVINYAQIEEGTISSEFEPYKEKEFLYDMNKYDEEGNIVGYYELSKINDTRDDLDFVSGILNEKAGKIVLTGDENFSMPSRFDKTTHYFEYVLSDKFPIFPTITNPKDEFCNYFKIGNPYSENTFDSFWVFYNTTSQSNVVRFGFKDEKFATSVDFKKWLKTLYNSGNPVIIYYIMETPEQIQLKPINVELFKGYNRITLEDKYGIVEELKMTYLTDSKLNGQYATKTELKIESDKISSEVNKKVSTDNFNSTVEDISNKMTQTANETNSTLQEILNTNDEQETKINSLTQTTNGLNIEISEQKKSYDSLNGKLVDIEGTLKDMTFDFSTKGLAIGTSTDANNSLLDNTGIKVYNYDKLNAIFNNRGSGLDKLIVTGAAQIGYLKFVKSTKNGKPGTKIFYVKKSIESLEDLL